MVLSLTTTVRSICLPFSSHRNVRLVVPLEFAVFFTMSRPTVRDMVFAGDDTGALTLVSAAETELAAIAKNNPTASIADLRARKNVPETKKSWLGCIVFTW